MYSVNWIEKNLGITRKAIIYYEKQGLIPKNSRNPINDYRDYDERGINRIWAVKTLLKIGFTAKEVKKIIYERGNNFYEQLSKKIKKLEKNLTETIKYYELAKTIKLTGNIPTINDFGSIKFDDFIEYTYKNFNFNNFKILSYANQINDKIQNNDMALLSDKHVEKFEAILNDRCSHVIGAYLMSLSKLSMLKYSDKPVQEIVDLIYIEFNKLWQQEEGHDLAKGRFAEHFASGFVGDGDMAKANKLLYGEKECEFIADALLYFGKCDSSNKL